MRMLPCLFLLLLLASVWTETGGADGNKTRWAPISPVITDLLDLAVSGSTLVGAANPPIISSDGGATWEELPIEGLPENPQGGIGLPLAVHADGALLLGLGPVQVGVDDPADFGIFRFAGGTWTQVSSTLVGPNDFESGPGGIWVADGEFGTWRSSGGAGWVAANAGLGEQTTIRLASDPTNPSRLWAGTLDNGVYVFQGGSWSPIGLGETIVFGLAADPNESGTVYAAGICTDFGGQVEVDCSTGGIFKRTAGGGWTQLLEGDFSFGAVAVDGATQPSTIYAAGLSVSRSRDGGASWETIDEGLPPPGVPFFINRVVVTGDDVLAALQGSQGGVYRLEEDADTDLDGVSDPVEDAAPNGGDGNEDGVADSVQAHVASLPNGVDGSYVTLAGRPGTSLVSVQASDNFGAPGLLPDGLSFPFGFFSFRLEGLEPGGSEVVQLLLPEGAAVDTFYKVRGGVFPTVEEFVFDGETGARFEGREVSLHFVDGGRGDFDNQANGVVVDPGGPAASVKTPFFFPQVVDGSAGTIRFQTSLILTNTDEDTTVDVEFFSSPDGAPMEVSLEGHGTDSQFEIPLSRGESISLDSEGAGQLQVGYARVSGDGIDGVLVFARRDTASGIQLFETGVPAAPSLMEFSLLVDSRGDRNTGLAVVNGGEEAAVISVRLYDQEFNLIAEQTLDPLEPRAHLARFVDELFDDEDVRARAREMQGVLTVESSAPIAAVTLRLTEPAQQFPDAVPSLTTFPVIPRRPEQ